MVVFIAAILVIKNKIAKDATAIFDCSSIFIFDYLQSRLSILLELLSEKTREITPIYNYLSPGCIFLVFFRT